jgi:hypothetical protein
MAANWTDKKAKKVSEELEQIEFERTADGEVVPVVHDFKPYFKWDLDLGVGRYKNLMGNEQTTHLEQRVSFTNYRHGYRRWEERRPIDRIVPYGTDLGLRECEEEKYVVIVDMCIEGVNQVFEWATDSGYSRRPLLLAIKQGRQARDHYPPETIPCFALIGTKSHDKILPNGVKKVFLSPVFMPLDFILPPPALRAVAGFLRLADSSQDQEKIEESAIDDSVPFE